MANRLGGIASRVLSARILNTGQKLRVEQRGERCLLHGIPRTPPDRLDTVLELKLGGPPRYLGCKDHSDRGIDRVFKRRKSRRT